MFKTGVLVRSALALSLVGCAADDVNLSSTEQLAQVTVCHYDAQGRVRQITISEDAAAAHEDHHGDHGLIAFYTDADGDGFGAGDALHACAQPAGTSTNSDDCNDGDAAVNPAAAEECGDGADNNCDGTTLDPSTYYVDADGDGYGTTPVEYCTQPPGTATVAGDCDDTKNYANPGHAEVCGDNTDNNCDGQLAQSTAVFMFASSGGQQFNAPQGSCTTHRDVTVQICRETPTQRVKLSSTSNGAGNMYYDELGTVIVTRPDATSAGANYRWWEANCSDTAYPIVPMGTAPATLDITPLFGSQFGTFSVRVQVRNAFQPYEWYETWAVPVN